MSLDNFKVLKKLGFGKYSSVYKVERILDGQVYALKKVTLTVMKNKEIQNALNEVRILASIHHPGVIGYRQAFLDENTKSLCIIMEYAEKGDLFHRIAQNRENNERFSQREIWSIFIQITRGLKSLHKQNIMHRDLKTANVFLFENGEAKIGDMNISTIIEKGLCQTQAGTPYYASPEVWKDQAYGIKSDVWSLGCVLYELIALKPPFQAEDMQTLYKKITKGNYPKIPDEFSLDLSTLLRSLLQLDPNKRPSCQKILNMAIVQKRGKKYAEEINESCVFLETIRIPMDLYSLTESLPKSNYSNLKRLDNLKSQSSIDIEKITLKNQKFPQSRKWNRSYVVNHRTIINAARLQVQEDRSLIIPQDIIKRRTANEKNRKTPTNAKKPQMEGKTPQLRNVCQGISLINLKAINKK